ncbi:MAG: hypothetical protein AAFV93_07180 [Chloroflexota bacterium]
MAWTDPTNWQAGDPLTADRLNTEVKDNLVHLKNKPVVTYQSTSSYSTSSTGYIVVDSTNLSHTLVTEGGNVLILCSGYATNNTAGSNNHFGVSVDGVDNIHLSVFTQDVANRLYPVSFHLLATGLAAGTHTFELKYSTSGGGLFFYRPIFTAQEL